MAKKRENRQQEQWHQNKEKQEKQRQVDDTLVDVSDVEMTEACVYSSIKDALSSRLGVGKRKSTSDLSSDRAFKRPKSILE